MWRPQRSGLSRGAQLLWPLLTHACHCALGSTPLSRLPALPLCRPPAARSDQTRTYWFNAASLEAEIEFALVRWAG